MLSGSAEQARRADLGFFEEGGGAKLDRDIGS